MSSKRRRYKAKRQQRARKAVDDGFNHFNSLPNTDCPDCGKVWGCTCPLEDADERERNEDDGRFYSHPGDRLRGLE